MEGKQKCTSFKGNSGLYKVLFFEVWPLFWLVMMTVKSVNHIFINFKLFTLMIYTIFVLIIFRMGTLPFHLRKNFYYAKIMGQHSVREKETSLRSLNQNKL